ncbi:hypothetical protein ABPG72_022814 [Tetrahymena utriculariae]
MGCALYGYTVVPLYDMDKMLFHIYIFYQTQLTTCFCSSESVKSILEISQLHKLTNIVSLEILDEQIILQIQQRGINLFYYSDLLKQGREDLKDLPKDVTPQSIFSFSYTSGTTANPLKGIPKAAMLSYRNFVSLIPSKGEIDINETDSQLCYLPLPNILQRVFNIGCWSTGRKIIFYRGYITKLKEDI